ncbi:MAG: hypothetical protein M1827_003163 [Pycnora praestabilis]|nr:MAG: hypothetical protein M1827_003163 [Pycnora praestabilis]
MAWVPKVGFDGYDYSNHHLEAMRVVGPYLASDAQDLLPCDDGPIDSEDRVEEKVTSRSLEERISGRPQLQDSLNFQQHWAMQGMDDTDERMGYRGVRSPTVIPGINMPAVAARQDTSSNTNQNKNSNTGGQRKSEKARLEKAADWRATLKAKLAERTSNWNTPVRETELDELPSTRTKNKISTDIKREKDLLQTAKIKEREKIDLKGLVVEAKAATRGNHQVGEHQASRRVMKPKISNPSEHIWRRESDKSDVLLKASARANTATREGELMSKKPKRSLDSSGQSSEPSEQGEIRPGSHHYEEKAYQTNGSANGWNPPKLDSGTENHHLDDTLVVSTNDLDLCPQVMSFHSEQVAEDLQSPGPSGAYIACQQDNHQQLQDDRRSCVTGQRLLTIYERSRDISNQEASRQDGIAAEAEGYCRSIALRGAGAGSELLPTTLHTERDLSYLEDLEDWLEMTGYYDREYRKKALQRHQDLVALDVQRINLEREAQAEHEERAPFRSSTSFALMEARSLFTTAMPLPRIPVWNDRTTPTTRLPVPSTSVHPDMVKVGEMSQEPPYTEVASSTVKKSLRRGYEADHHGPRRLEKPAKINYNGRFTPRGNDTSEKWFTCAPSAETQGADLYGSSLVVSARQRGRSSSPLPHYAFGRNEILTSQGISDREMSALRIRQSTPGRGVLAPDAPLGHRDTYDIGAARPNGRGAPKIDDYRDKFVHQRTSDEGPKGGFPQRSVEKHNQSVRNASRDRSRGRG